MRAFDTGALIWKKQGQGSSREARLLADRNRIPINERPVGTNVCEVRIPTLLNWLESLYQTTDIKFYEVRMLRTAMRTTLEDLETDVIWIERHVLAAWIVAGSICAMVAHNFPHPISLLACVIAFAIPLISACFHLLEAHKE